MFTNPVVGGVQLIRNAIQSVNYVPGVSGWAIFRDGTAEFATGTFRGPVVIIDPATGTVLATINANGQASFQTVEAKDYTINGVSLSATLSAIGKGIVGQFRTSSTLPNPGTSSSFVNTCWTQFIYDTARTYRISATTAEFKNTASVADSNLMARAVFNQPGLSGGASNEIVHLTRLSATAGEQQGLGINFYMSGSSSRTIGGSTMTLQLSSDDGVQWTHQDASGTNIFMWTVEDVGPLITSIGNTGTPSGSLTYVVTYTALASRSYDGSGNYIGAPDGDNNIYVSTFADRPYTNERFEVIFDGATMRSDLSGATFTYARLWLYCFKAEEANGSVRFGVTTDTAVETVLNDSNIVSQTWADDDAWPVPGWAYFDLLSSQGGHTTLDEFLSFSGNGIIAQQPFPHGVAATGFRGYGTNGFRPYIEIKYTGNAPSGGGGSGYGTGGYGTQGYGI